MTMQFKSFAIAAAAAVSGLVLAPLAANAQNIPREHDKGGVIYISGGDDPGEARAIHHMARDYSVELDFRERGAAPYGLDGVKVRLKDSRGFTLLDTKAAGPMMLMTLPTGHYTVIADYNGRVRYHELHIADGLHDHVKFDWAA
jgi:hypothetical protein